MGNWNITIPYGGEERVSTLDPQSTIAENVKRFDEG